MSNPFLGKTYGESIAELATKYAHRDALVFRDTRYSYRHMKREADAYSARLAALGLRQGDHVSILLPNRPEFLWAWLGAAQMGLVVVMINTRLKRDEIAYQLAQSDSKAVIVPGAGAFRDFLGELSELAPALRSGTAGTLQSERLPELRWVIALDTVPEDYRGATDWSRPPTERHEAPAMVEDVETPGIIGYSSGTTALPKGALISHQVWRKAWDIGTPVDFTENDCLYMAIPLFGSMATMNGALPIWVRGGKVVLGEQFDAAACLAAIEREKVTVIHLLPPIVRALLDDAAFDRHDRSSLRVGYVLSVDPDVLNAVSDGLGIPGMMTGYGMTETTTVLTRNRWDDPRDVRHTTQGKPLPDIEVRIIDPESRREMPVDQPGEIWARGYCNMLGYYKKPEETARALTKDGWLRTGDVGHMRADGRLVYIGRLGDGYKSRGFNVSPAEIEYAINSHPEVAISAVVGIPWPGENDIGIAYVVLKEGCEVDSAALLDRLRGQLASYKLPHHLFLVDELPMTSGTGKIQKFKLKEDALVRLGVDVPPVAAARAGS
ncbi:class I adenylate-forming enzyme family protein [Pseudohoeflea coraliihabitans]|uniref:AMP-binding protein n=1 Tax=Pseudohoeflea coraliihabitans TaxID=2860393 RepID=A0ABS6WIN7_9HYPH|nr:AMP-binding protein [Pseudohoeflea sp. DP4N28-3]MBW3095806.1 AMP-binding protein [Pseudohoeflea sp. DP4N28-3]